MANIVLSVECKRCQHIWILETAKNVSVALHKANINEACIAILKKIHWVYALNWYGTQQSCCN